MKWSDSGGGKEFEAAPIGNHVGRCIGLIDIGTQQGEYQGKTTHARKVVVRWELPNELISEGDWAGKPFVVSKFYTASLSEKANLRFKEVLRLTNDFARALDLDPNQVCLELGQYDCRAVHNIALGGVEPRELGLVEPTPSTTITTPIAVERLAVHACERRVTADLDSPSAAIFAGIDSGTIANLDDASITGAIDSLYKRAVLRPAKETEIAHLTELSATVPPSALPLSSVKAPFEVRFAAAAFTVPKSLVLPAVMFAVPSPEVTTQ
jgi:hypothetical protein